MSSDDTMSRPDPNRGKAPSANSGRAGGSKNLAPATRVTLDRTDSPPTSDERLWDVIRDRTDALTFNNYKEYIDDVLVGDNLFRGVEGYATLKSATRAWLQYEAGVWLLPRNSKINDPVSALYNQTGLPPTKSTNAPQTIADVTALRDEYLSSLEKDLKVLPYHKLIVNSLGARPLKDPNVIFGDYGISPAQLFRPVLLELIWSYWHEEGMLVQAMNAISRRFQNRRTATSGTDPLFRLEIDPLRTVNNLIWGYVQDEWNLLTVQRRAYEYQHEYGISLLGKAIPGFDPADSRPRFLTAFHDLLLECSSFFDADDDTTVVADAFGVLNALKDVHPILAEGAHNQFGDLVWTARSEMLIQQWILSRPEFREFLGGRTMVAYREPWMDRVDTIRQLLGWGDTSVTHFRDLGVFGERLLLSIRYGNWSVVNDSRAAENWARYWRPEIKSYMHSYRVVTGVELSGRAQETIDVSRDGRYIPPAVLLQRRLEQRRPARALPRGVSANGAGAASPSRAIVRGGPGA
jgi:hypothetical protein